MTGRVVWLARAPARCAAMPAAAMKIFVPRLRAEGYRFVSVSTLAGASRDKVMPPVSPRDRAMLGGDKLAFYSLFVVENFLRWAFLAGIALGAARVLWMTVLALVGWRRDRRRQHVHPKGHPRRPPGRRQRTKRL